MQEVVDTQEMKAVPAMMSEETKVQRGAEEQKKIAEFGKMIALGAEKEGYEKALSGVEEELTALRNISEAPQEKSTSFFAKISGMFRNSSRGVDTDAKRREMDRQHSTLEEKRIMLKKKIADIDALLMSK